jgi:anti-sigma factor RsiW
MTRSVAAADVTCKDSRLIEAYLDGELDPSALVEVEAHLNGRGNGANGEAPCVLCRERLALGRATRQSLKRVVRTASLEMASGGRDALRARALTAMMAEQGRQSAANAPPPEFARPGFTGPHDGRFHWRTLVPIASAAALALFWGAASRGPLSDSRGFFSDTRDARGASMRAGMAGDDFLADLLHEHSNPMPPQWTDPRDVRALDQYIGVPVQPARFERNGALLVGARVLPVHQQRAAMLQYVIGHGASQRRLSVFIYDPSKIEISGPGFSPRSVGTAQVRVGQESGYSVAVTQNGGVGYAVASDLGTDQSAELAALAGASGP